MAGSKVGLGIVFVVLLVPVGFVLGAVVGAPFVPADSGLAGGAIVVGYAAIGALAALVLGLVLAFKLPRHHLVTATWLALAGLLLAAIVLFFRYRSVQQERAEEIVAQVTRLKKDPPPR